MDPLVPPEVVELYIDTLKRLLEDPENDELLRQVELQMEFDPRAFGQAVKKVLGDTHHTLMMSRIGAARTQEWQNCINNQHCTPSAIRSPSSLQDLIAIIQEAKSGGKTVRAVGSGHSFSNVAITYNPNSILVKPQGMKKVHVTDPSVLSPNVISSKLVTVESGITIADLNKTLDSMKLALTNMGAFDAQTISGAISTGTHGTGVSLGPIGSSVRAIIIVSESGTVYQIEPVNGISDPEKFKRKNPDIVLKQDDDWFHSVVVSMGCMGLIYAYILEVEDAYLLKEIRTPHTWEDLKTQLVFTSNQLPPIITSTRHVEIIINPYPLEIPGTSIGAHLCILTKRWKHGPPIFGSRGPGDFFSGLLAKFKFVQWLLVKIFNATPSFIPRAIKMGLDSLVHQGYVDKSYKVLNLGAVNEVRAFAVEFAFDIKDTVSKIDQLLDIISSYKTRDGKGWWMTGPIGVRFVSAADAYLAPQYGRTTAMAELDMLCDVNHGAELLREIESKMTVDPSVRVHWGLDLDVLTRAQVETTYPKFNEWLTVYRTLNSTGIFNSPFTDRLGISTQKVS